MMKSQSGGERNDTSTQQKKGGLLTTRILNALPYASSVKNYYYQTKQSNELLKVGLNLAETCAVAASSPFLHKYETIDRFAASQLDKLEDMYGENLISKSVGAVVYPFVFTQGLVQFTRDKVVTLATPAIEMSYELADVIVDNLMPPESDETLEQEYSKLSTLKQKSPFRRVAKRANVHSVVRLPFNAVTLSRNAVFSSVYISLGFSTMVLARMFRVVATLVDSINSLALFDELLQRPWTVLSSGEISKLYHAIVFHGTKYVNQVIGEVEDHAVELSQYLEHEKLPYNSKLIAFVAQKLKTLQQRLARTAGVIELPSEEVLLSRKLTATRRYVSPKKHVISAERRMPSMILGENLFDQRTTALEESRMPSMIWGEVPHVAKKERKSPEEIQDGAPDVDEHGYTLAKPKPHDHLIPADMARQWGEQMLLHHSHTIPVTPTNSPADALSNNPYSDIVVEESELVGGPDAADSHEMKERKEQQEKEEARRVEEASWEVPKHPIHVQLEVPVPEPNPEVLPVPENNPFGKLAEVDPSEDPFTMGVSSM